MVYVFENTSDALCSKQLSASVQRYQYVSLHNIGNKYEVKSVTSYFNLNLKFVLFFNS